MDLDGILEEILSGAGYSSESSDNLISSEEEAELDKALTAPDGDVSGDVGGAEAAHSDGSDDDGVFTVDAQAREEQGDSSSSSSSEEETVRRRGRRGRPSTRSARRARSSAQGRSPLGSRAPRGRGRNGGNRRGARTGRTSARGAASASAPAQTPSQSSWANTDPRPELPVFEPSRPAGPHFPTDFARCHLNVSLIFQVVFHR